MVGRQLNLNANVVSWRIKSKNPTFDNYKEQFKIFTDSLVHGGIMVYNEEDTHVKEVVEGSENRIKKYAYTTPEYFIEDGIIEDDKLGLKVIRHKYHNKIKHYLKQKWILHGPPDTDILVNYVLAQENMS